MKYRRISVLTMIIPVIMLLNACKKDWLNAKPNKSLVVPTAVADYQDLLDNTGLMNNTYPSLSMAGDGDYYVTDARYAALTQPEMNAYIWAPTTDNFYFSGYPASDWQAAYTRILNDNVTLDGIQTLKTDATNQAAYNNVKGSALFYRSLDFYFLAQNFCKGYLISTANSDLGLPLRTSSNINIKFDRSNVQQTYDQIINDLMVAVPLLPIKPSYLTRPSKPAAFALLSRVFLSQGNYPKALLYADSCLQINSSLMDFNSLSTTSANPIARFNKEVVFGCSLASYGSFRVGRLIVDSTLFRSYSTNDLRTSAYFITSSGVISFRGSYDGTSTFFGGIATDEMYLNRAECNARAGNTNTAMKDLNTLLQTRWKTGTYTPLTAANADLALAIILTERRKELCFRALRWTDLKRLNQESRFQTTLVRKVNGQTYTILPNSPRYALPLDPIEIQLGGLQQNPR